MDPVSTTTASQSAVPGPALPKPEGVLRALDRLRDRIRRLFWIDGSVMFGIAVCATVFVSFTLDYLLHLPQLVRFVVLIAALLYWVSVFIRRLLRPRGVDLPLDDLAGLVESQNPELKQAMVTAVQLSQSTNRSAAYLSNALISGLVRDVEKSLATVSFSRVVQTTRLKKCMLCLAVLLVALFYGASAHSDLAGKWFRRSVLLSSEPWPKSVHLSLVRPVVNPTTVAIGESLPVEVQVMKGDPGEVEIAYWTDDRGRRTDLMRSAPDRTFKKVFERVNEPFTFQVRGGDHELENVEVRVLFRPRISDLAIWCEYPEYTGKESTPDESPILNGHLRVPQGTRVRYRAVSDVPIEEAYIQFQTSAELLRGKKGEKERLPIDTDEADGSEWPPAGSESLRVVSLSDEPGFLPHGDGSGDSSAVFAGSGLEGEFVVQKEGNYRFHLQGDNGLVNERPVRFRLKMIRDQKPVVRFEKPKRSSEEVSAEADVPLNLEVRDDYGIKSAEILGVIYRVEQEGQELGQEIQIPLEELTAETSTNASKKSSVDRVLEIASFGIAEDSRLMFYAVARDFGGNVGESERYTLHIISKEAVLKQLLDSLMVVKDQLHGVIRHQESARRDVENFQEDARLKEKIDKTSANKLAGLRQNQNRVTRGLKHAVGEIDEVLSKMASNRVGEEKDKQWISKIRDRVRELAEKNSPAVEEEIRDVKQRAVKSVQDSSALDPILEAQKAIEKQTNNIAMEMTEFGDINAILQQWRRILEREIGIRDRIKGGLKRSGGQ